ncbi:hypothetical protein ACF3NT_13855 [Naumannella halotolerans]|uniref:hypothetical protein n=1 Tax=Naumannella halotolerans TaxID=993414 RepID=UPI00370D496A
MFPRAEVEIEVSIPPGDDYWVPKPCEIDEEGFGDFRGVWPIAKATTRLTADVIEDERVAAEYVDAHASTPEEFEKLARQIESYSPSLDESEAPDLGPRWDGLESLELGVAGLTYALSNAGFYPAASCRSHEGDRSWSPNPVVLFAGDKPRAVLLQPLVRESGCGLRADCTRGDFLCVYAPSIRETMTLATAIYENRVSFRKLPKTGRKQSPSKPKAPSQPTLF